VSESTRRNFPRYEIVISGSGGQGIILAGIVLAEAGIKDSLFVVQTASYGPESRGGASQSDVILATEPIDYPAIIHPDFIIALTEAAAEKFLPEAKSTTKVLLDSTWIGKIPRTHAEEVYLVPLTKDSALRFGKAIYANIIAVGFFTGVSGVLSAESVREAMNLHIPKKFLEENLSAFEFGLELAKKEEPVKVEKVGTIFSR